MDLFLEIIDGPLQGNRTPLRQGLTIGRKECDLTIEDSKISSKHARLEARADGAFWLVDLGSANGIRFEGRRSTELQLDKGMTFRLGRTRFKVLSANEDVAGITDIKNLIAKGGKTWRDLVISLSERAIREIPPAKVRNTGLTPFPTPLLMKFTRGLQSGTEWTLGYAPREVGATSVDLPLFEPGLPAKVFSLLVRDDQVVIRLSDEMYGKILLNGKRIETAFILNGDVLDIGNTRIEISL